MKIVILHPPLYPVNHKLFNELGKHSELTVICFGNRPGLHKNWEVKFFLDDSNTYKLIILEGETDLSKLAVSFSLQSSPKFLKYIKEIKPHIIISVAFWMPSIYTAILKNILRFKLVILTDAIPFVDSNVSFTRKILRKFIISQTDCVLAGSNLTVSYIKSLSKKVIIEKSIQTIDLEEWNSKLSLLEDKQNLRKKYGYDSNVRILLSVGHLIELKNVSSIINELRTIENCILLIIGDGPLKNELQSQVDSENLDDKVFFLPKMYNSDLIEHFSLSDVFIFPSKLDRFGFVVSEALASSLPVICSKNTGASELIKDGYNGFLIKPEESYANKIDDILLNLEEMSINSKISIQEYTLKNKALNIYNILNNL